MEYLKVPPAVWKTLPDDKKAKQVEKFNKGKPKKRYRKRFKSTSDITSQDKNLSMSSRPKVAEKTSDGRRKKRARTAPWPI